MWGRCPIGSRYTKAGGRGSWRYAFPRMTQVATFCLPPDPFPGVIEEAAAMSIPLHFSQVFLNLPNVAVSKAMALICGYRIDETICRFLTCSAQDATKRTILQPHSIRYAGYYCDRCYNYVGWRILCRSAPFGSPICVQWLLQILNRCISIAHHTAILTSDHLPQ